MRSLAALSLVALAASCIPEAHASPPPLTLSQQVSAQLGMPISVPLALAGMSADEVVAIARALPAHVTLEAVTMIPAVGPGYVDSFSKSCTSAAAVTELPSATVSYTCQNASTTKVAVGDSTISDPGTATDAPVYCATNCPSQEWGGAARQEYCRGDTDTTVVCRALVAVVSAP